jgi:hypothetical protein
VRLVVVPPALKPLLTNTFRMTSRKPPVGPAWPTLFTLRMLINMAEIIGIRTKSMTPQQMDLARWKLYTSAVSSAKSHPLA